MSKILKVCEFLNNWKNWKKQKKIALQKSPKKHKKNAFFFKKISSFKDIIIQPELSSPPRFRIQGGYPERDGQRTGEGQRTEILVSILDNSFLAVKQ